MNKRTGAYRLQLLHYVFKSVFTSYFTRARAEAGVAKWLLMHQVKFNSPSILNTRFHQSSSSVFLRPEPKGFGSFGRERVVDLRLESISLVSSSSPSSSLASWCASSLSFSIDKSCVTVHALTFSIPLCISHLAPLDMQA